MTSVLYHGGAAGFDVGAYIEPHETRRLDGCPVCAAGGDANHLPDRVFATPVRIYAKYYASKWGDGTVYLVESAEWSALERSEADSIETYHASALRVVRVAEQRVLLTPSERRHVYRVWKEADLAQGRGVGLADSLADLRLQRALGIRA